MKDWCDDFQTRADRYNEVLGIIIVSVWFFIKHQWEKYLEFNDYIRLKSIALYRVRITVTLVN